MMAAGVAAEHGARTLLIEKNPRPGRKLLLTGGGRCNLTNIEYDIGTLAARYRNGKFLYHALSAFGPAETVEFFKRIGLLTKADPGGRVFPVSERAFDVLRALEDWLSGLRVKVMNRANVSGFIKGEDGVAGVRLADGVLSARSYVLCTGGRSFPKTGSTGDGYSFARSLGHKISPLFPALVPLTVREDWLRQAEGASLSDAAISVIAGGKRRGTCRGECVFTGRGISGPAALNASGTVSEFAGRGEVKLTVDLAPGMGPSELDNELMESFDESPNRLLKNSVTGLLPPKLVPVILAVAGLDGEMRVNRLSRQGRQGLARTMKALELTVSGPGGFEKAMVTRGGVDTSEVDPKTMRSKLAGNLFLAGEVLDVDGESGGYNLQACWSTGWLAGANAAAYMPALRPLRC